MALHTCKAPRQYNTQIEQFSQGLFIKLLFVVEVAIGGVVIIVVAFDMIIRIVGFVVIVVAEFF